MKCVILVGGYGTRLRPLTLSCPKPLVPFNNKAIVEHQIAAAARAGVDEVILAVGFQPEAMLGALDELERRYNIKITCSIEREPLGTAGPIRLVQSILESSKHEEFFVFNSDVICEFPLEAFVHFHRAHGGAGTICVTQVTDPSKYGVVVFDNSSGKIDRFVEKPREYISDQINAGLYILNKSVISKIPALGNFAMFEKDVFPVLASEGSLFCFKLPGHWADIGQPKDYLSGMKMHLAYMSQVPKVCDEGSRLVSKTEAKERGFTVIGNVWIHDSAVIERDSVLGPDVTVGPDCIVEMGARVKESALFESSRVGRSAFVNGSIVGWKSKIGNFARVEPMSVLGEDVVISEEILVNGAFFLPHKTQREAVWDHGKIIM